MPPVFEKYRIQKITALCCVVTLLFVCLCPFLMSSAEVDDVSGDVNGDGNVGVNDTMMVFYHVNRKITLTQEQIARCDANGDGNLDLRDALYWYRVINRLIETTTKATTTTTTRPVPQPVNGLTPLDRNLYYGRQQLITNERSALVEAYDSLDEQVNDYKQTINVSEFNLTLPEFERVLRYYHDDHPEVFWLGLEYSYRYITVNGVQRMYDMTQTYAYSKEQIISLQYRVQVRAEELLEGITDATPQAEREKLVHDRLIKAAAYDSSTKAQHAHDMLGVLLYGTGMCDSYTRAFQYLMYQCGINSAVVTGNIKSNGAAHAWNIIKIDGNWYHVDLTWDDPVLTPPNPTYVRYNYYNITDTKMYAERTRTYAYSNFNSSYLVTYKAPTCTTSGDSIILKSAVSISSFDMTAIAAELAKSIVDNRVATFKPTGGYTVARLKQEFTTPSNYWALVEKINTHLPASEQLVNPGYNFSEDTTEGLLSIYMREY